MNTVLNTSTVARSRSIRALTIGVALVAAGLVAPPGTASPDPKLVQPACRIVDCTDLQFPSPTHGVIVSGAPKGRS